MHRPAFPLRVVVVGIIWSGVASLSVASPALVTVVQSTDEQFLLVSGTDREDVEATVQEAAARGFRLLALSLTSREGGLHRLGCLLKQREAVDGSARS